MLRVAPVLLGVLLGCSASDDAATPSTSQASLVGALNGTDARVGLVVNDTKGVLYVCGGATTRAALTRWFGGSRTAAGIDWTTDDLRVVAAPSGKGWSGEVRKMDGSAMTFALTPAEGSVAGLYQALLPEGRAGVVVFPDATILGTFKTTAGVFEQVLPVREVSRTPNGIEVQITGRTFFVQPVVP
jgi:hypothetical protein